MDEQGIEAAFDAAEQKVREYPNCGKLIHMMASMVQGNEEFRELLRLYENK